MKQTQKEKELRLRYLRNQKLQETDKYLLPDYPISKEDLEKVKGYREKLRHLTEEPGFPDIGIPELEI